MPDSSPAPARVAQPRANDYQQRTEANAAATAAQVAAVVAAYRVGRIERPELPQWVGTTVTAGAARAAHMADLALSADLARVIGRPVPAVGLVLPNDTAREIAQGVATIVSESTTETTPELFEDDEPETDDELEIRLDRLAHAAPLDAGQEAHQDAMIAQGISGWTRQTDLDPCPLCIKLADGKVIGIDKRMIRHPDCSCIAVPVLSGAAPYQHPDEGSDDPATFVPVTLRTGHGVAGREITRAAPGLTIRRSVFIPARARTR